MVGWVTGLKDEEIVFGHEWRDTGEKEWRTEVMDPPRTHRGQSALIRQGAFIPFLLSLTSSRFRRTGQKIKLKQSHKNLLAGLLHSLPFSQCNSIRERERESEGVRMRERWRRERGESKERKADREAGGERWKKDGKVSCKK